MDKKEPVFLVTVLNDKLNLKPSPSISTETFRLWDWIVAEGFIGADFQNIRGYKEFEISPQGESADPHIDLAPPTTKMVGFGTLVCGGRSCRLGEENVVWRDAHTILCLRKRFSLS